MKLTMTKELRAEFGPLFNKQRRAAPPEIRVAFLEILQLFRVDSTHPVLRNHQLKDRYAGFQSIDITGDWRAIYRMEKDRIIFVALGTHTQLYG